MNERMKILIAYDGSECADAALDDLQKAGLPSCDVDALLISVAEVWLPPPPPTVYEVVGAAEESQTPAELQRWYGSRAQEVLEAERLAARAAERLQKNFPGWAISPEAACGSPAWEIIMTADRWKPDLVVVGSHGRNVIGRFFLGSVSQKVLTESRTSVRVSRGRVEVEPAAVRVVVGVDGSAGAQAAVREVASRTWPTGTDVKVIAVQDPVPPLPIGSFIPIATRFENSDETKSVWVQRTAGMAVDELRSAGLSAVSLVVEGDPKRALIEEAEKWGTDAVFVGSTGFSNRFERFLLGSVSAAVAARAHCSVEVVRARPSSE
jgi:nucleotide-binding universal stress UspA family protein